MVEVSVKAKLSVSPEITPLLVKLPLTCSSLPVATCNVYPEATVSARHAAAAVMAGPKLPVKFVSPMTASTVDVGTPDVQLEAFDHTESAAPVHEVDWAGAVRPAKRQSRLKRIDFFMAAFVLKGITSLDRTGGRHQASAGQFLRM